MSGPEERGPHRGGGRGRDEVRAWCVKKTGGTLGWPVRDFGVTELRAEPAGARRGGDGRWFRPQITEL